MICRIWRGWTDRNKAEAYRHLLQGAIIPAIEGRRIPGFLRIEMMRRDLDTEVEFATIMWFDSLEAVAGFVGNDVEVAHVPSAAREILTRWDEQVVHYQVFDHRDQPKG